MNLNPLMFVSCFMFVAVLLLIGVLYSRAHWIAKAALITVSLVFSVMFYEAYLGSLGYPARITPPAIFRFVYGVVREPSPADHDPGAIYVWIMLLNTEQPRAIVLPYTDDDRRKISVAEKQVQEGQQVFMGVSAGEKPREPTAQSRGDTQGDPANKMTASGHSSNVPYKVTGQQLDFKVPPDTLPDKERMHD